MAKKALVNKQQRKPKYKVRAYTRCRRCGRPRSVFRKFGLCRLCLREMVHNGEVWQGASADTASGRWYIDERFRRASGEVGILLAHYEDEYVRTADGWRFSNRLLQIHYQGAPDLSDEFLNSAEKIAARTSTDA